MERLPEVSALLEMVISLSREMVIEIVIPAPVHPIVHPTGTFMLYRPVCVPYQR